jgi:hypothetical protein
VAPDLAAPALPCARWSSVRTSSSWSTYSSGSALYGLEDIVFQCGPRPGIPRPLPLPRLSGSRARRAEQAGQAEGRLASVPAGTSGPAETRSLRLGNIPQRCRVHILNAITAIAFRQARRTASLHFLRSFAYRPSGRPQHAPDRVLPICYCSHREHLLHETGLRFKGMRGDRCTRCATCAVRTTRWGGAWRRTMLLPKFWTSRSLDR